MAAKRDVRPALNWFFEKKNPRLQSNDKKIDTGLSVDLGGMIREATQNSNDAKLDSTSAKPARFSYKVLLLSGKAKENFIAAGKLGDFDKRVKAASENSHLTHSNKGLRTRLRQASKRLQELDSTVLPVLIITDEGTKGLQGDDLDVDSSFYTFTHTVGRSQDKGDGKGGSHGVGKGLLWELSAFRVIFLATVDANSPNLGARLYGVCNNVEHTVAGTAFTGPGYFGLPDDQSDGHAYSLRGAERTELDALFLDSPAPSGLSICIPGLIPEEDLVDALWQKVTSKNYEAGAIKVAERIGEELISSFWPALAWKRFEATVTCESIGSTRKLLFTKKIDSSAISDRPDLHRLSMAFDKAAGGVSEHDPREGIGSYVIPAVVPAEKDGNKEVHPKIATKAILVLAKLDDDETRQVQTIRGTGMVISRKYVSFADFTSEPGWAGVLLAGKSAFRHRTLKEEVPQDGADALDQFLTSCEGATHVAWIPEQAAVAVYTRVHTESALNSLRKEVRNTIRDVLQDPEEERMERPAWFNLFRVKGTTKLGPKKFYMKATERMNDGDEVELTAHFDLGKQKSAKPLQLRAQLITDKGPLVISNRNITSVRTKLDLMKIGPASGALDVRLRFRELNVNAVRAGLRVWLEREREDGAET